MKLAPFAAVAAFSLLVTACASRPDDTPIVDTPQTTTGGGTTGGGTTGGGTTGGGSTGG